AWKIPVVASTDSIDLALMSRYIDGDNYYHALLHFHNDSTVDVRIRKVVDGVFSLLATSALLPGTYGPDDWYHLRMSTIGSRIRARGWRDGDAEPAGWQVDVADTSLPGAGRVGVRANLQQNNDNALPVVGSADDYIPHHQALTVAGGGNGVSKSHNAGTAVQVARSGVIAL